MRYIDFVHTFEDGTNLNYIFLDYPTFKVVNKKWCAAHFDKIYYFSCKYTFHYLLSSKYIEVDSSCHYLHSWLKWRILSQTSTEGSGKIFFFWFFLLGFKYTLRTCFESKNFLPKFFIYFIQTWPSDVKKLKKECRTRTRNY